VASKGQGRDSLGLLAPLAASALEEEEEDPMGVRGYKGPTTQPDVFIPMSQLCIQMMMTVTRDVSSPSFLFYTLCINNVICISNL